MTCSTVLIRLVAPVSRGIASTLAASPSHCREIHFSADSSWLPWGRREASQKAFAGPSVSDCGRWSSTSSLSASLRRKFDLTRRELSSNVLVDGTHRCTLPTSALSVRRISALADTSRAMASMTSSPDPNSPVVTPHWLADNLKHVKSVRVKGAQFFDLEAIADPNTDLPHMLPSSEAFSAAASALGLSNDSHIVIYDGKGIFSAARAWWMFRTFGHDTVWVLSGGLPLYKSLNLPIEEGGDVQAAKAVMTGVLTTDGQLKEAEELEKEFISVGVDLEGPVVASCGTGVTACVLVLALHKLGKKNVPVYDGSWTEWADSVDAPVETTNV